MREMQNRGVLNCTTSGRASARASATVTAYISGTGPTALESTSTLATSSRVGWSIGGAGTPTPNAADCGMTLKAARAMNVWPSGGSAVSSADQIPGVSKSAGSTT